MWWLIEILVGMFSDDDLDRLLWPAIVLLVIVVILAVVAIKSMGIV